MLAKLQDTFAPFSKVMPFPVMTAVQYFVQEPMVKPGPNKKKGMPLAVYHFTIWVKMENGGLSITTQFSGYSSAL